MTRIWAAPLVVLALAAAGGMPHAQQVTGSADAAFEAQVAEYLRRYPYQQTYDYAMRFTGGDPARLNTWAVRGEPTLVRAGDDVIPRTNNDTYYQSATLWLEDGPVVITASASARDRFTSLQLVDDRNVNYRNVIHPRGAYTLYFGRRPDRVHGEAIEVPSRFSIVLVRVEVKNQDDAADVAAARAVFKGLTIAGGTPARFPAVDLLSGYPEAAATEARRRMDETFANVPFSRLVVGPGQEPGRDVPALYHAAGTKGGWGGPDPSHSAYEAILVDENGEAMEGRRGTYTVTTGEPPVDAFWSVTVYDTGRGSRLYPNAGNRYHINNTMAVRNDDGSVTFTFKPACEAMAVNCLPVPAGPFDLVARYYLPRPAIISGAWTLPKVGLRKD